MPKFTIAIGVLLVILGPAAYVISGMSSFTANLPAFPGLLLILCGVLALNPKLTKHAMHAAAVVALLGVIGGLGMAIPGTLKWLGSDSNEPLRLAVKVQWLLGIPSAVLLIACIRSFIAVRKQRQAEQPAQPAGT
ncbi:MAG: hypothetical protein AAF750_11260 [Planctomycetota bacterium]